MTELPELRLTEEQSFTFAFVPLLLLFYQFGLRFVVRCRLADRGMRVMLFGVLPIAYVASYHRIGEVRRRNLSGFRILAVRFDNGLIGPGVVIRSKGRLLPVTLTPDDPDGFMREVRRRAFRETGWLP